MAKETIMAQCRICGGDVPIEVDKREADEMRKGARPVTICKKCAMKGNRKN